MKAVTLSARFDGEHIRLEEAYPLRQGARLLVTVLPDTPDDEARAREFWRQLGAQGLERAYGPSEPEYDVSMVREPNPRYEAR